MVSEEIPSAPATPQAPPPSISADAVADGLERQLHPSTVVIGRLVAFAVLISIALPLFIAHTVVTLLLPLRGWLPLTLYAALGMLTAVFGALAWILPPLEHRRARYRVDQLGFSIRRGVLWRTDTSVPRARVQHTDVKQGPLQRRYGSATLVIHTAGTQDASVSVGGLPHAVAMDIRDYLIVGGDEDGI